MDERGSPNGEREGGSNLTVTTLKKVIGLSGTLALIREWGGTRVFVPKTMTVRHRLSRLLGKEVATRLSEHLGGNTLAIPGKVTGQREKRNIEIVRLYDSGLSVKELARRFDLTDRTIYNILSLPFDKENDHG